jgi:serine/threonine-protein kinase
VSTPRSIDAGIGLGEIFLEKYRIDAILGQGGMGIVAMCTHLALNECVAIKMLRRDVLDDVEAVERFMREAQAASKLKSEYVARVTDVGRSSANVPYMVMEYLEGHDLGQLLEERGSIALPWAVELTLQACEALAEAHSIGIVHRDVKPSNLFVTWRPDGSALIKVLDFGISKSPIVNAMQLTQTQSLLGTPAYMSPEQMRSAHKVDTRTDIWSLGTVLYELLEGRRPFEAESFSEMCVKVAVDPPDEMTNTPLPMQQIVLRCLAKAPEQRYSSMAELASQLVPFSQDPHQAQVLVERMSRMLRRSQMIDWDPARSSMPMQVREIRSMERQAEAAADAAPEPAISATDLSGISAREPVPSPSPSPSESPSPLEPYAAPRRKRRGAILVAAALSGAAVLGVMISLSREPAPNRPTAPPDHMNVPVPKQPIANQPSTTGPAKLQGSAANVVPETVPDTRQADQPSETVERQATSRDPNPRVVKRAKGAKKKANSSPKLDAKHEARPPCDAFAAPRPGEECIPPKPGSQTN